MPKDNFLVVNFQKGVQQYYEPFLLDNDAFPFLENVFCWRGRIRKKWSSGLLGRLHLTPAPLPEAKGNTVNPGTTFSAVITNVPVSPGTVVITAGALTFTDNGNGTLTSPAANVNFGVINYQTGAFTIFMNPGVGIVAVAIAAYRYLPRLPVMGLPLYENVLVNKEDLIAFDTTYSYRWNAGTNRFDQIPTTVWSGNDTQFFWTCNYYRDPANNANLLWAVNDVVNSGAGLNGIKYWNGTAWSAAMQPNLDVGATRFLRTALMLVPYKDRLLALNTQEGAAAPGAAVRFAQRARWSQNGTPIFASDATAWLDDTPGKGGYIDAPTNEAIVSCRMIRDVLIVFFERSTWQLRYTGNEILPFIWEQINAELGGESTFGTVNLDKNIVAIGEQGIIGTDTVNVARIDLQIPDVIFTFNNENTAQMRVHGTRDFFNQLVYWCYVDNSFPTDQQGTSYPNKILVYNYPENSYAFFDACYTCFGRFQSSVDYTWSTLPYTSWSDWTDPWNSAKGSAFLPEPVGGNPTGFVMKIDNGTGENDVSVDLTAISSANPAVVSALNHNLSSGQFVTIRNVRGLTTAIVNQNIGTAGIGTVSFIGQIPNLAVPGDIIPSYSPLQGTVVITIGANTFTDLGNGTLAGGAGGSTIDYETGIVNLRYAALGADTAVLASYDRSSINHRTFYIIRLTQNTFSLYNISPTTDQPIPFDTTGFGAYAGSGEITVVDNFEIITKRFNPYMGDGQKARASYVDWFLEPVEGDEVTCFVYSDDSPSTVVEQQVIPLTRPGGPTIGSFKNWYRVYMNNVGQFIQFKLSLTNYQMTNPEVNSNSFLVHGINIYFQPSGRIIGFS